MDFARTVRRRRSAFTLIEIMIVVGIFGIVIGIAVPTWIKQRLLSRQRVCQENLSKIDGAKELWALENNKTSSDTPGWDNLVRGDGTGYIKKQPACPAGGSYTIGIVGTDTLCSITAPADHNQKTAHATSGN